MEGHGYNKGRRGALALRGMQQDGLAPGHYASAGARGDKPVKCPNRTRTSTFLRQPSAGKPEREKYGIAGWCMSSRLGPILVRLGAEAMGGVDHILQLHRVVERIRVQHGDALELLLPAAQFLDIGVVRGAPQVTVRF